MPTAANRSVTTPVASRQAGRPRRASRWALRVGALTGIDIYVHATLGIFLLWIAGARWATDHDLLGMITTVGFMTALFVCILLHELGHATVARKLGIRTLKITLSPIGGVASLERLPDEPRHELLIALAGPAVSLMLAVLFGALAWLFTGSIDTRAIVTPSGAAFLGALATLNGTLALFNLLPALPLDGGRVFRALLAMRMDFTRATDVAAMLGQGIALLFGIVGLFLSPMLLVVAYFVWMGAVQESASARARAVLHGLPVRAAMATRLNALRSDEPLSAAASLIVDGFQGLFPIVSAHGPVGVLSVVDVVRGLAERGPTAPVETMMQRQFSVVDPDASLEDALLRDDGQGGPLIVVRDGNVLGVVTAENVGELVLMKSAIRTFTEAHSAA